MLQMHQLIFLNKAYHKFTLRVARYRGTMRIEFRNVANRVAESFSAYRPEHMHELATGKFFLNAKGKYQSLIGMAIDSGLFEDTGRRVGLDELQVWRIR